MPRSLDLPGRSTGNIGLISVTMLRAPVSRTVSAIFVSEQT